MTSDEGDSDSSEGSDRPTRPFGFLMPREQGGARWLPLLIGLLVVAGTAILAERQSTSQRRALDGATDAALREAGGAIDLHIQSQLRALSRLRARWVNNGDVDEEQFAGHAGALVRDFGHIRSIQWADRDYVIRWSASISGVASVIGTKLGRTPDERAAYDAARELEGPWLTPPVRLLSGDPGFIIVYPLHRDGVFDGFLMGVYDGAVVLSSMLAHVATRYDVEVSGVTGPVWDRRGPASDPRHARSAELQLENQIWTLTLTPHPEIVSTYLTPLPVLMVAASVLLGALLAAALRGAWLGRIRNRHLRQANTRLASEVTRRTRAEESEKATREELASVVNSLPAYVWSAIAQPDGVMKTRYESDFIEVITGLPAGTFHERSDWMALVHADDRDRMGRIFVDLIEGRVDEDSSEYRLRHVDGGMRFIRQRVRVTETAEGRRLDGVALDFTDLHEVEEERALLEARMQEAQRLESLGSLAGGIAHDFNNLLVAMLGHASLARQDLAPDDPAQNSLGSIERAARRAADLCRQMLAYAGMGSVAEERIDLRDVVEEMRDLLRASIPRTIALETDLDTEPAGVEADPSQMRQVVLNLITNAAEAIGDGPGRVDVSVGRLEANASLLAAHLLGEHLEPGPYVALRVRDDGCGMVEETRRRIFEPFFSTKFQGRGLGLAAVLGIVKRCRGALRIESAPGQGTTITVLLRPVALPQSQVEIPAPSTETRINGGHVLLVEDDEAARDFAATVLERAGLRVSQAADGVEGVEFFEKHLGELQCVVLDLTMPRMDGVETGRRMRALDADIALVLSSGYPEQDALKRFGALGITGFLEKPYEPDRLVEAVRVAMRRRDRGGDTDAGDDADCGDDTE